MGEEKMEIGMVLQMPGEEFERVKGKFASDLAKLMKADPEEIEILETCHIEHTPTAE